MPFLLIRIKSIFINFISFNYKKISNIRIFLNFSDQPRTTRYLYFIFECTKNMYKTNIYASPFLDFRKSYF
jgi:hypothetical protein